MLLLTVLCSSSQVAFFLMIEAARRLYEPPEVQGERLLEVACVGLVVNLMGVYFFQRYTQGQGRSLGARLGITQIGSAGLSSRDSTQAALSSNARQSNLQLVLLHIMADTASSIGVIISAWLVKDSEMHFADAMVSMCISIVIFYTVLPSFSEHGHMLLQTRPREISWFLDRALREASAVDSVLECHHEHFWTHAPGVYVGSLTVRIRADGDEQLAMIAVERIFKPVITHLTVQVEKDQPLDAWYSNDTRAEMAGPESHLSPASRRMMAAQESTPENIYTAQGHIPAVPRPKAGGTKRTKRSPSNTAGNAVTLG
jgi:cobalt-zinc-cadmium efflux system protein